MLLCCSTACQQTARARAFRKRGCSYQRAKTNNQRDITEATRKNRGNNLSKYTMPCLQVHYYRSENGKQGLNRHKHAGKVAPRETGGRGRPKGKQEGGATPLCSRFYGAQHCSRATTTTVEPALRRPPLLSLRVSTCKACSATSPLPLPPRTPHS